MTKKLKPYAVQYTMRAVVMAEDAIHAHLVAEDEWRDVRQESPGLIDVDGEVRRLGDLPAGWDMRGIPYGGDGNTRLAQLIEPKE